MHARASRGRTHFSPAIAAQGSGRGIWYALTDIEQKVSPTHKKRVIMVDVRGEMD